MIFAENWKLYISKKWSLTENCKIPKKIFVVQCIFEATLDADGGDGGGWWDINTISATITTFRETGIVDLPSSSQRGAKKCNQLSYWL